jgi:beta-lactamase superfamily II metal-dependent hydrolase
MDSLSATLIDVGWGDSILLERVDSQGNRYFGLIDSNDKAEEKSSFIFLRRHFEKRGIDWQNKQHLFDFMLLSHAHSDHGKGLKFLMKKFGAKQFWYPQSIGWGSLADLLRYANKSSKVQHHQSVDDSKILPAWGNVRMEILWPRHHEIDPHNENNNSVVLVLRLGEAAFVLTGDAEEEVWGQIADSIPDDTLFFKVPHHGSVNGTFGSSGSTPWFDSCPNAASLGISAHLRPFSHPHQRVVDLFEQHQREYFRTDHHYHVTFRTDGNGLQVQYSH